MVGRALGAGEGETAYDAAARMIVLATAVGGVAALLLLVAEPWAIAAFTDDPGVQEQARILWPLLIVMQPVAGAVFALDGILIGAGDTRYIMWAMVAAAAVFAVVDVAVVAFGWGLSGVWAGLVAFLLARLATLLPRFRGRRWAIVGAGA
jgi:Na+-driven multidrug efflux pump